MASDLISEIPYSLQEFSMNSWLYKTKVLLSEIPVWTSNHWNKIVVQNGNADQTPIFVSKLKVNELTSLNFQHTYLFVCQMRWHLQLRWEIKVIHSVNVMHNLKFKRFVRSQIVSRDRIIFRIRQDKHVGKWVIIFSFFSLDFFWTTFLQLYS